MVFSYGTPRMASWGGLPSTVMETQHCSDSSLAFRRALNMPDGGMASDKAACWTEPACEPRDRPPWMGASAERTGRVWVLADEGAVGGVVVCGDGAAGGAGCAVEGGATRFLSSAGSR